MKLSRRNVAGREARGEVVEDVLQNGRKRCEAVRGGAAERMAVP